MPAFDAMIRSPFDANERAKAIRVPLGDNPAMTIARLSETYCSGRLLRHAESRRPRTAAIGLVKRKVLLGAFR